MPTTGADPLKRSATPPRSRVVRLPDGLRLRATSRLECAFLHDEVFRRRVYWRPPLALPRTGWVVDVGAHVGLFAAFVGIEAPDTRLLCFEPLPPTFRILERNARDHFPDAILLREGLGARCGPATFHYYPRATGWSTAFPDEETVRQGLRTWLDRARLNLPQRAYRALGRAMPGLQRRIFDRVFERLRRGRTAFPGRMRRLSAVLAEQRVDRVELLKIDVEGGELEVLRGIDAPDWPRIRAVVLETQGPTEPADPVADLLRGRGFDVVCRQPETLRGTAYRYIYGTRPD
jgi:FkbM family methyltransferase